MGAFYYGRNFRIFDKKLFPTTFNETDNDESHFRNNQTTKYTGGKVHTIETGTCILNIETYYTEYGPRTDHTPRNLNDDEEYWMVTFLYRNYNDFGFHKISL